MTGSVYEPLSVYLSERNEPSHTNDICRDRAATRKAAASLSSQVPGLVGK